MSSSKDNRFEKTFSRKKKDSATTTTTAAAATEKKSNNGKRESSEKQLVTKQSKTKAPPSSSSSKTQIKIRFNAPKPIINPPKNTTSSPMSKKKNVASGSVKSKQQKAKPEKGENLDKEKKRKAENQNVGRGKEEMKKKIKATTKAKNGKNEKKEKDKDEEEGLECVFPMARIARIVKSEGTDYKLSGEAVFLINKATEKFIELFSEEAHGYAVEDRKSFVAYKHLASAVSKGKWFDFLSDFVPEKVTAEKALAERKPPETLPV